MSQQTATATQTKYIKMIETPVPKPVPALGIPTTISMLIFLKKLPSDGEETKR